MTLYLRDIWGSVLQYMALLQDVDTVGVYCIVTSLGISRIAHRGLRHICLTSKATRTYKQLCLFRRVLGGIGRLVILWCLLLVVRLF